MTTDWRAVAQAHLERGEPVLARRAARRAGPPTAELRLLLAWIEQDSGNSRACLRQLDLAQPHLRGALLARARCLRGLTRCVAGDYLEAHRELSAAVAGSRSHDDQRWLANALNARGVVRTYLRRLPAADRDLLAAQELYASLGQYERAATCLHNRGFAALQAGDPLRALELFDAAVAAGLRVDARAEALIDRAYALLAADLVVPAGDALNRAAGLLGGAGRCMRLAEATLAFGQCTARAGRSDLALDAARRARDLFRAQRRVGWQVCAESLELRLTMSPSSVPAARALARRCVRFGYRVEAAELRLAAAAVADRQTARRLLGLAQADRLRGAARLRALGWLARARRAGDRRAVLAACRAGLRTGAGEVADELLRTGLSALLDSGDPASVIRWVSGVRLPELADCLGSMALLLFVEHAGQFVAGSVVDGRARLHQLGPAPIDVDGLRFALATSDGNAAAHRVDTVLLAPFRAVLGDRPLVIVPSDGLRGLPWAALETAAGRPLSVAPSVPAWLRAHRVEYTLDNSVWIAGPGLRHANREVTDLHRVWGGTVLRSSESTMDNVLAAMDGAGLVHIAAHGRYGGVELADGLLRACDIDRLARPPRILVLSACEVALTPLPHKGTRAVVASTLPVVDAAAGELVGRFHGYLRAGMGAAEALVRAQGECGDVGFVCVGAG